MIAACEDTEATVELPEAFEPADDLYLGMDIGRKKDLSVIWIDEKKGDVFWTRMVLVLKKCHLGCSVKHCINFWSCQSCAGPV